MKLSFRIDAIPVAQPRQRQRVVHANGKAFASNYTPTKHPVNTYKAAVQGDAIDALTHASTSALQGPLGCRLVFVFPRPQNRIWKSKPMPREAKTGKPDIDNICKSTFDAMNGVVFTDDAQIAKLEVEKWIASGDEPPHVEVCIWTL